MRPDGPFHNRQADLMGPGVALIPVTDALLQLCRGAARLLLQRWADAGSVSLDCLERKL